ncbi:MAG: hypothetical protein PVF27_00195, partial [Gemmatimonadales bacterium]
HLAACAECRATVAQLERVRQWAADYDGRPPAGDVWPGIEAAIRSGRAARLPPSARWRWFVRRDVLAWAAALVLVAAGSFWLARVTSPEPTALPVTVATVEPTSQSTGVALLAAERYGAAVAQLEHALLNDARYLDSATVRVVREKLVVIDRAIADARDALARDPNSDYLAEHFASMLRRKLAMLRHAASIAASS